MKLNKERSKEAMEIIRSCVLVIRSYSEHDGDCPTIECLACEAIRRARRFLAEVDRANRNNGE